MTYVIAFRRNDRIGQEEYDAGHTISEARKEGAFFAANLPADIEIRIAKILPLGRLQTVEYIKRAKA